MAKNRNKKKQQKDGASSMDISSTTVVTDAPQAMDTMETIAPNPVLGVQNRKIKKGTPLRRAKNLRKKKAIEKAISRSDKSEVKIMKNEKKTSRTQSAKTLYE